MVDIPMNATPLELANEVKQRLLTGRITQADIERLANGFIEMAEEADEMEGERDAAHEQLDELEEWKREALERFPILENMKL